MGRSHFFIQKLNQRRLGLIFLMIPVAAFHGHVRLVDGHQQALLIVSQIRNDDLFNQLVGSAQIAAAAIQNHQHQINQQIAGAVCFLQFVCNAFGVPPVGLFAIAQARRIKKNDIFKVIPCNMHGFGVGALPHPGLFGIKQGIDGG